ncbi:LysR family transcriptional regulator [Paracoccus sp. TOH]|uniref:LysR family transcriptional regulator n=1 Tax=Paracoccus sp. TOH TaxID=1263728 RepID=UPI0025B10A89|nr:LysR family transcriptional regulator [Paracoccus sp. TOH]WJS86556.1 LysR family transcriptional regulator [Paracoccus sp. TOH]
MNWDDFRIISAICKTGSFARAARLLQIDETTVGRRVARIEAGLEMPLFEPADGMRRPTGGCLAILRPLQEMEAAAARIQRALRQQDYADRVFRISTVAAIAEHWLAPHLPHLLQELPELSLSIDTSDDNVEMSRWEADFALRLGRPKYGTFLMRRIGEIGFSLVRPRDLAPEAEVLAAYPQMLADTPEMLGLLSRFRGRAIRLETANLNLIRAMLDSGRGIGILPDLMVQGLLRRDDVSVTPMPITREVWLLSQPHLRNDELARRLSEWCATLFPARRDA